MKFRSQTFKVARCCVRKKAEVEDVEDAELDSLDERGKTAGPAPWDTQGQQDMGAVMDVSEEKRERHLEHGHSRQWTQAQSGGHSCAGLPLLLSAATLSTWLTGEASGVGIVLSQ